MLDSAQDYKQLLTRVIKNQIIILGPTITLAKARKVKGLNISDDGTVISISQQPEEITKQLIKQFTELSSIIAKKTIQPLMQQANTPLSPQEEKSIKVERGGI